MDAYATAKTNIETTYSSQQTQPTTRNNKEKGKERRRGGTSGKDGEMGRKWGGLSLGNTWDSLEEAGEGKEWVGGGGGWSKIDVKR